jgi:hypothetical protein
VQIREHNLFFGIIPAWIILLIAFWGNRTMYRRIELIDESEPNTTVEERFVVNLSMKSGLCGRSTWEVADAWIGWLQAPQSGIPRNARFYFTETGWDKVGRAVVAACQRSGQRYRLIAVKENAIDVVFRDEYQVAGQPVRRLRKDGLRRPRKGEAF